MSQLQNSMYVAVSLGSRDRNMTTAIPISIQKLKRFDIIHTALWNITLRMAMSWLTYKFSK